jgi:hypothetical protein
MKFYIIVFFFIWFCNNLNGQDQVKILDSKQLVEGKIIELKIDYLKIRLPDLLESKIYYEAIDSIFTLSDSLRKRIRFKKGIRDKLTKKQIIGPMQERYSISKFDSISSDPKELAKSLAIAQNNILKINRRDKKAGKSLANAGSLLILGSFVAVLGSTIAITGTPKSGIAISVFGGILGLVGYGKLVTSGNILQGTNAKDLRVGVGNEGLAIQLRF